MKRAPRGTTLVEVCLALCLLAGGFAGTAQLLTACARQRTAVEKQFAAQGEAANVVERVATMPYEDLTPEKLQQLSLSAETQAILPGGKLAIACVDLAEPDVPHKRVAVKVTWPTSAGTERAVQLTTWKYASAARQP